MTSTRPSHGTQYPRLLLCLCWLLSTSACSTPPPPSAPHHVEGGGFRNLYGPTLTKSMWTFMKMRMSEPWADHEAQASEVPRVTPDRARLMNPQGTQVTWLGHSAFLFQRAGVNLLTDPVFSERASPVSFAGPKRYTALPLKASELPEIHAVIISHNHYDHLDVDTISELDQRDAPLWFVPLRNGELLTDEGVDPARVIELDWWQQHKVTLPVLNQEGARAGVEVRFTSTPAQHWSARGLFDRYEMLWGSWAVEVKGWRVFFAGDTGFQERMFQDIRERSGPFDLGLIPIGAYAPRDFMKTMHINPEEAVKVHQLIEARRSVGMHWGTFPLTSEPVIEPQTKLREASDTAGLPDQAFTTLALGETLTLDEPVKASINPSSSRSAEP